jgi:hypothetical protein
MQSSAQLPDDFPPFKQRPRPGTSPASPTTDWTIRADALGDDRRPGRGWISPMAARRHMQSPDSPFGAPASAWSGTEAHRGAHVQSLAKLPPEELADRLFAECQLNSKLRDQLVMLLLLENGFDPGVDHSAGSACHHKITNLFSQAPHRPARWFWIMCHPHIS